MESRYGVIKALDRGGFGKIDLVFDRLNNQYVVKKSLLFADYENGQRLVSEGYHLIALRDEPNIIDILDWDFNSRNPFLILPYYQDGSLQSGVGRTNWYDTAAILQNIAGALDAVHRRGGVHRDVKPANVYKVATPEGNRVLLGDFGLGQIPFGNWNLTMLGRGTPGYMAKELSVPGAKFTKACDIYSLGITGIELLTGSKDPMVIQNFWGINEPLRRLLMQMVAEEPNFRPTAKQVMDATREIVEQHQNDMSLVAGIGLAVGVFFLLRSLTSE